MIRDYAGCFIIFALIEENSLFEDEFEFLRVKEWCREDFLVS